VIGALPSEERQERDRAWIFGLPVDLVDRAQALQEAASIIERGAPGLIVTADASALIIAKRDDAFARIMRSADLVTADGAGVVRALRHLGHPVRERVCGVDLVVDLSGLAAERGWRIFLLGAAPGVAERAAENLQKRFPGLQLAGVHHGFFSDDASIVRQIRDSRADLLFIGMGMPRQEKWFWEHRNELGVRLAMGVGGSLDVLSGRVKRAPEFFQRHGLEWLYRFACAPKKSSRKIVLLPLFAGLTFAEARRRRKDRQTAGDHEQSGD
jgi:N-acetylglucosaminyldiphosphoundecaprenol N-acetyl-beta-D-mannosaminyltransferase